MKEKLNVILHLHQTDFQARFTTSNYFRVRA